MAIKAIPTIYRGVMFRSRLEARWAAFFDLCKWHWDYEPFDCDGWIPDFLIRGKTNLLVEVKPAIEFPSDVAVKIEKACESSPLDGFELLILGSVVPVRFDEVGGIVWNDRNIIGWLGESWDEDPPRSDGTQFSWHAALCGVACQGDSIGIGHATGSYHNRITGGYDGNPLYDDGLPKTVQDLWREAGNVVQWRKVAR